MRTYEATQNKVIINPSLSVNSKAANITVHTVPITIKRFYTDVDGQIILKNTLPINLQNETPVYLLGSFDLSGGYKTAHQITPPKGDWKYLHSYISGLFSSSNIVGFTGLNQVETYIKIGDIVQVFTDDKINPNYFCWVIQTSNNAGSIASVVENTKTTQKDSRYGMLYINEINYFAQNDLQFGNSLNYCRIDNIGNYTNNPIDPLMFDNPYVRQQGFLIIETEFLLDQFLLLTTYINFDIDEIQLNFKLKKQ